MTKTISSRIDNRTHDDLIERCNKLGCNINEFVGESVKFLLSNESDFEFDLEESDSSNTEEPKPQITIREIPTKEISKVQNVRVVE